jgi:hypothetical protein
LTACHKTTACTTAATKAHAAPFGALQKHHGNQADCEDKMDDENDIFHERPQVRVCNNPSLFAAYLGDATRRRKPRVSQL